MLLSSLHTSLSVYTLNTKKRDMLHAGEMRSYGLSDTHRQVYQSSKTVLGVYMFRSVHAFQMTYKYPSNWHGDGSRWNMVKDGERSFLVINAKKTYRPWMAWEFMWLPQLVIPTKNRTPNMKNPSRSLTARLPLKKLQKGPNRKGSSCLPTMASEQRSTFFHPRLTGHEALKSWFVYRDPYNGLSSSPKKPG